MKLICFLLFFLFLISSFFFLQTEDSAGYEADEDSIQVTHQGEQDTATATIMASVEQQDGMKILLHP